MTEMKRFRDQSTGRYSFWNRFERMCVCGHRLGVHTGGGFDCLNSDSHVPSFLGDDGKEYPGGDGTPCDCMKFRQSRKKASPP
jgi:hypothetical protein